VSFKFGFDVIHAHNPPDTLWVVALPWRLLGSTFSPPRSRPELYRSHYGAGHDFLAKMLQLAEWGNLKLANVTIATNESYKQIQVERGGRKPETVFVVRNGPNKDRMQVPSPSKRLRDMQKKILVYIGSLNPQDGVDYLLRSLKHLVYDLKRDDFHCVIIGSGDSLEDLRDLAKRLKLNGHVELTGYISDRNFRKLAAADIYGSRSSSPLNDVSSGSK
jgi:glycosyltransferase involved in cell wall biosynthesis